jgi:pyrroloquinoline quinone biosynthesis protein B
MSAAARARKPGFSARTQSSLAVSADGRQWVLLNCSPDLRQQIADNPELWPDPKGPLRNSPIKAVIVTNADVDHIIGLINLREGTPFTIYGSARVLTTIKANSVFNVCNPQIVPRIELPLDTPLAIEDHGESLGLTVEAFAVPGKIALFLEDASDKASFGSREGDTIGLKVTETATGRFFYYVPGCAEVDPPLADRLRGAPLIFFDGTLYTDDEMIRQGLLNKTGARMGHISISGSNGSIAAFKDLGVTRKIYVHINNSNPVLDDTSPERKVAEGAGWEVGFDGMEIRI